jgi:hypothetical protein
MDKQIRHITFFSRLPFLYSSLQSGDIYYPVYACKAVGRVMTDCSQMTISSAGNVADSDRVKVHTQMTAQGLHAKSTCPPLMGIFASGEARKTIFKFAAVTRSRKLLSQSPIMERAGAALGN